MMTVTETTVFVDELLEAETVSELIEMLTSIQIVYGDCPIHFDAGYNNISAVIEPS